MRLLKTFLPIVVIILLFQINTTCAEESSLHDKYFYAVLDAQIESIKTGEYRTMDRIYDLEKTVIGPMSYWWSYLITMWVAQLYLLCMNS